MTENYGIAQAPIIYPTCKHGLEANERENWIIQLRKRDYIYETPYI